MSREPNLDIDSSFSHESSIKAEEEYIQPVRTLRDAIHSFLTPHMGEGRNSQHIGTTEEAIRLGPMTIQHFLDLEIISSPEDLLFDVVENERIPGKATLIFKQAKDAEINFKAAHGYTSSVSSFKVSATSPEN